MKNNLNVEVRLSVILSFAAFGIILFATESSTFSAAQDVLAGTDLPTSTLLLVLESVFLVLAIVGPHLAIAVPVLLSLFVISALISGGLLVLALVGNVYWKLFSVTMLGFGYGYGQTIALYLISFFHAQTGSAFSSGTSIGFMLVLLYYTAMTTWIGVSSMVTLVTLSPLSLLLFACYYVINKNRSSKICTIDDVVYTKISSSDSSTVDTQDVNHAKLTLKEKISAFMMLLKTTAVPLYLTFFSKYLILNAIVTTVAYENAPFSPRDHFQYYFLCFYFGELFGRVHRTALSLINNKWLYTVTLKGLWTLAFIGVLHLLILFFESWYRFLPGVQIVLCLCFTAGIAEGLLHPNAIEYLGQCLVEKQRPFGLGFMSFPMCVGVLSASVLGLRVEAQLKEHCMATVTDSAYCITRSLSS